MNAFEALALVARTEFRPMNEDDFYGFAGVKNSDALIAETEEYIIILDGDVISVLNEEGTEAQFLLGENRLA